MNAFLKSTIVVGSVLTMLLSAPSAHAVDEGVLNAKPEIATPDVKNYDYELIWYNHFDGQLYVVKMTNPATSSDDLGDNNNALFKSWCNIWTPDPSKIHGKLLVAADEHFKIDYSSWERAPFNLPHLWVRLFEIQDDEHFWIIEMSK